MKTKKQATPYAVDKDGKCLFVKMKASGIHPMVVMCDAMTMVFFGKRRTAYLRVVDVIAWHEKELAETNGRSGDRVVCDLLRRALEAFEAGRDVDE